MSSTTSKKIKERLDPALLSSLSFNFRSPVEAICELIDNAVDEMIHGELMKITITCRKGSLSVTSKGGSGMDLEQLEEFLHWGKQKHEKGRLGRYGQGGKAAMGYLGKECVVRANPTGGDTQYVIKDSDWRDRSGGLKEYAPMEEPAPVPGVGVVQIEVRDLERKPNVRQLMEELSWRYAPLIKQEKVEILMNDKNVEPEVIPLAKSREFKMRLKDVPSPYPGDSDRTISPQLRGWVGISKQNTEARGGIRVAASGRVVLRDEYFGHKTPTLKASMNHLVGEVEMGFVPLKLNKDDFDRDSPAWKKAAPLMRRVMKPFVEELLARKEEELPSDVEVERAMLARDIVFKALERMEEATRLMGMSGLSLGQKKPVQGVLEEGKEGPKEEGAQRGKYQPATPPPPRAVGDRKRRAKWGDFDIRPMDETIRSAVIREKGRSMLLINNRFPAYRAAKGDIMYMVETAAAELAKPEPSDPQDAEYYRETMNRILAEASQVILDVKSRRSHG